MENLTLRQMQIERVIDRYCFDFPFGPDVEALFTEEELATVSVQAEKFRNLLRKVNRVKLPREESLFSETFEDFYFALIADYLGDITIEKVSKKLETMTEQTEEKKELEAFLAALKHRMETKEEVNEVKEKIKNILSKDQNKAIR